MATIEQRFKQFAYKPLKSGFRIRPTMKRNEPINEKILFLICDKLERSDFKEPFFNKAGVMNLGDGFKFLTYCGKNQRENINKNALVIQKKLSKGGDFIYRVYLMDEDGFNIRKLFSSFGGRKSIKENNYSLLVSDYVNGIKEHYNKKELIFIINKIVGELVNWSLEQK